MLLLKWAESADLVIQRSLRNVMDAHKLDWRRC